MKIKVSDATPNQLNFLVARCEALGTDKLRIKAGKVFIKDCDALIPCEFSTDWAQGGPIIEREGIELLCNLTATEAARFVGGAHADWQAFYRNTRRTEERSFAITPLLAAMRCYITSKLGNEVEVPEELK